MVGSPGRTIKGQPREAPSSEGEPVSCYAANMVTGRWQPNANIALVEWARNLLKEVEATGRPVHWVHIKGHSSDGGNDRADELVQWGKALGPYCRLREGGSEGNSLDRAVIDRCV